ncbi:hypothetical protein HDR63_02765 [bacterium]|nr:hypothetical protein [bacterium]
MPNPNVGLNAVWADRTDQRLESYLEYVSCAIRAGCNGPLSSYVYSAATANVNLEAFAQGAVTACDPSNTTFVSYVIPNIAQRQALMKDVGEAIAGAHTFCYYPDQYIEFIKDWLFPIFIEYVGIRDIYPSEAEYYGVAFSGEYIDYDTGTFKISMPIKTCPNGGQVHHTTSVKYSPFAVGIENCYTTTFSETSGSGVYTSECYYTK